MNPAHSLIHRLILISNSNNVIKCTDLAVVIKDTILIKCPAKVNDWQDSTKWAGFIEWAGLTCGQDSTQSNQSGVENGDVEVT